MFLEVENWILRNARAIELSLWNYFFRKGRKEEVLSALSVYQNEDGGFGHALEPDNWNPASTPYTTCYAIHLLREIEFTDLEHPIYQGVLRYLRSQKDFMEYGWQFTIPSNDHYAHAPWWDYNEKANPTESIGITASLASFVLKYEDKNSLLYQSALKLVHNLTDKMFSDEEAGDMGLDGFILLLNTLEELGIAGFNYSAMREWLSKWVKQAIEHDTSKWCYYVVRPSYYIRSSDSIYYDENREIVQKELQYLIQTRPENGVWGITWTWFENQEKYNKEFTISENWWKANKAIEHIRFLEAFGVLAKEIDEK